MKADLALRRFGKLKVICPTNKKRLGKDLWLCVCDCGSEKIVRVDALRNGSTRSCGCLYFANRSHSEPPPVSKARWIPLGNGRFTLVDDRDYKELSKYRWCLNHKYAQRRENKKIIWMHHVILRPPKGFVVDHISWDTLDNRRLNLRITNKSGNQQNSRILSSNTSGYRGVGWILRLKKWRATIQKNGDSLHLGTFNTSKEAARAYDKAAKQLYGSLARTNF